MLAKNSLDMFNQYINGEVYRYKVTRVSMAIHEGKKFYSEPDVLDECGGWYDIGDIADNIKDSHPQMAIALLQKIA